MILSVRRLLASLAVLVAAGVLAAPASAAEGDLAFTGCLGSLVGCPGVNPVGIMDGASTAAVSGDGKQLYVGAHFGNAVSHFTLDADAVPTFSDCVGHHPGCATPSAVDGVGNVRSLVLSGDGTHLYASSYFSNGFSWFTIDGAGALTFAGCFGDKPGCTAPAFAGLMTESEVVALSPDGKQLYVAAGMGNLSAGTVSHFTIGAGGTPTFANCVGTVTGCAPTNPTTALDGAHGLAVTPDGKQLYVAADGNATFQRGSVSHFTLDASGNPTFASCIGDTVGCATSSVPNALTYPTSLVPSRDGRRLYVGTNGAVADLALDAAGAMTFRDCLGAFAGCATTGSTFNAMWGLALSMDGKRLFATSYGGDNVSWLPLDAAGAPTFGGCIGVNASCTATTPAQALNGAFNLAPTPDGRHLFVTAYDAALLDAFDIEQPTPVGPGPSPLPLPPPALPVKGPVLSGYKLSPTRFAAAANGGSVAARTRGRVKAHTRVRVKHGTTVRFTLSEPATMAFTVKRQSAGRKLKRRCVAARKRNRDQPPCKRYVTLKGSFKATATKGANTLGFTGRMRGRKLAPGSYQLVAKARDAAGNSSAARRVGFTIVAG